jgi:hypothetical protein
MNAPDEDGEWMFVDTIDLQGSTHEEVRRELP